MFLTQRSGKRDIVLYLFMAAILLSIWLAMVQIDRQWLFIAATQDKLDSQTRDMADLRRLIQRGGLAVGTATTSSGTVLPESWRGFARAYAATQAEDYSKGDWLVNTFASQVPTLTPYMSGDNYATLVQEWVLDTLVTRDPETLEWLPLVAESWETSSDGLQITYKIRDGVVFSDGEPLTVEDVVFSWEMIMDERIAAPRQRAYTARIVNVTADAPFVTFHFDEPYFLAFEISGLMQIVPRHFYEKYLTSVSAAEEYNKSTGLLMGSGPYRLASPTDWKPGDLVELVRNERYWGWVTPPFDRRIWKTISSDAAQLTEFKNGGVDVYGALPLEYRDLIKDEFITARAQSYEYYSPVGGYIYIGWNNKREDKPSLFADQRVREAMTYLTDRQRIVDEILLGYALPINGPFNPFGPQANPDLPLRAFDLAKAKALLAEAGFKDRDGDGVIESADGVPFEFKLTYPSASDTYKRVILLLKDLYVRAGIIMEPDPTDWPVMITRLNNKTFDAVSLGWTGDLEIDVYQTLHSSQTEPGGDNFVNYINPELDRLIEAARREMQDDVRMPLWHKVHELLWQEQPYTYLFRSKSLVFVDRRIKNVKVEKATGLNSGGKWRVPLEWYVPAPEQKYSR
jgi:peptide/nickel transport system substrate-binding protein